MPADTPPTPKSEQRQRTKMLGVRLTPEEHAEMKRRQELGGFSSIADMIRVRCLGRRPLRPRLDMVKLVDVETAVNRVGVNVNQIAAIANTSGTISAVELSTVTDALERVYTHLDGLYPQR